LLSAGLMLSAIEFQSARLLRNVKFRR